MMGSVTTGVVMHLLSAQAVLTCFLYGPEMNGKHCGSEPEHVVLSK